MASTAAIFPGCDSPPLLPNRWIRCYSVRTCERCCATFAGRTVQSSPVKSSQAQSSWTSGWTSGPVKLDGRLDERLDERSRLAAPPLRYGMLRDARGMNGTVKLHERSSQVKLDERSRFPRGTNGPVKLDERSSQAGRTVFDGPGVRGPLISSNPIPGS